MTKKLLLTAAALGALAFAGAANAGSITALKLSNIDLIDASGTAPKVAPYAIALEADLAAAGTTSVDDATSFLTTTIGSPVSIANNAKASFAVSYTLTGPATFGTVAFGDLTAVTSTGTPPAVIVGSLPPSTGVATISADKKTVTFYVEYTAGADLSITGFKLDKLDVKVTAKQDVTIASEVKLTVGNFSEVIDNTAATKIVEFKAALKPSATTAYGVVADLPDFKKFEAKGAAQGAVANATTTAATSAPILLTENANVRKNLTGGNALTVSDILDGATATVTGPQVKALGAKLANQTADAATLTATSGVYTLTNANLIDATSTGSLVLTNPASPNTVVIDQGAYKVDLKPKFADGFTGSANQTLTLLNVTLDGTNFVAPWFALDNGTANSTLRLANNGSAAVGPVIISLKANNGAAAPAGTYTIDSIPANGFVSVRGDQLKSAFGTTAANGDLLITIQSDTANVSAKVRTTQSTGQIYENSLGRGSNALVN